MRRPIDFASFLGNFPNIWLRRDASTGVQLNLFACHYLYQIWFEYHEMFINFFSLHFEAGIL